VRRYPFNFTVWNSYAQLVKTTQSSEAAEKMYKRTNKFTKNEGGIPK